MLLVFLASVVGGALNAVAGGGSFLTLPALILLGVAPVAANATSTLAMWPGAVASGVAYRHEITIASKWVAALGAMSLIGGLLGALLLMHTSDTSFLRLLPWLMLVASLTFTAGDRLARHLPHGTMGVAMLLQLTISIYGGYYGGGMGIMMLATFALVGMTNIHVMNGLKIVMTVAINGVALVTFILNGAIVWGPAGVMIGGSVIGGYAGAALARRVDQVWVRGFVILVGWSMTIYFFAR